MRANERVFIRWKALVGAERAGGYGSSFFWWQAAYRRLQAARFVLQFHPAQLAN